MSKQQLTVKGIVALEPKDKSYEIRAGKGFGIRILPSGAKKFFQYYYTNGRHRQIVVGSHPETSLKEANKRAAEIRSQVDAGLDPLDIKEIDRKTMTLESLAQDYLESYAKVKKRSWKEDQRILNSYILKGSIRNKKAKDISRKHLKAILDKMVKENGKVIANQTYSVVRKMFNYALEAEIVEYSTCFGLSRPGGKETPKKRYLMEDEIKEFWLSLENKAVPAATRDALEIILLLGQRPGEICKMHRNDIKGSWWRIPGSTAKNDEEHTVIPAQNRIGNYRKKERIHLQIKHNRQIHNQSIPFPLHQTPL